MSMPTLPEMHYINRVLPHLWQRDYWQERLGMELDGCYASLCKSIKPKLHSLLKDDKWSSTERWMLETLANSEKPAPEWVSEKREEQEQA